MRNKIFSAFLLSSLAMSLGSCAEVQQAAEKAAAQSGNKRLAGAIHGSGALIAGLLPIGYEEESSIGQAIALQVVARYGGTVDDPQLVRYVNLIGRSVANTCDRPDIAYHFAILNHESINAFAAPAGYIFVTHGLLKQVQNEAELAAVLGHEIAHVSEKHILDVIQRSKQVAGVTEAGLSYAGKDPAAFKNVIDNAVKKLLDEGLDQGKEIEADQVGDVFAGRVGYDPTAYVTFLNRLKALKGDDKAFFKTHPNFSNRIQAVQQTIQAKGLKTNGLLLAERFAKLGKRL